MIIDLFTIAGIAMFALVLGFLFALRWCRKHGACS